MLQITIPASDGFDENTNEFITFDEVTIQLEHSLISLSKWEAKWHKAFLSKNDKTAEEVLDYVRCMTLTKNVDPSVYSRLTPENLEAVNNYISEPMTATVIRKNRSQGGSRDVVTSELIYYWMITLNIPIEFQKWHLNRLLTLIEVCTIKSQPAKKMGRGEIMRQNAALNAARRKKHHTRG